MGTNYYARIDACECCGGCKKKVHIGKSSIGWTFSFHSVNKMTSYSEWLKFLSCENIRIFDEYDTEMTIEDFKAMVESKKDAKYNHTEACIKEKYDNSYLDKEGHSMTKGDFS